MKRCMRIAIIGGNATGLAVAARLRRLSEDYEITVFEKGNVISYGNCGFPYALGNIISNSDDLIESCPDHFLENFNVEVRTLSEVIEISSHNKNLKIRDRNLLEYSFDYDKLVIATGSEAIRLDIPITFVEKSFALRDFSDFSRIKKYIEYNKPKTALIVGTGLVGLEVAENLSQIGIKVSIIEKAKRPAPWLDKEFSPIISKIFKKNNIDCYCGEEIVSFSNDGKEVITSDGWRLYTDILIFAVGTRPNTEFLNKEIALNKNGYIKVSERMQTSNSHIYATGDVAVYNDDIFPYAGSGIRNAKVVADSIHGIYKKRYQGHIQPSIMKFFDYQIAHIGSNESNLKKRKIDYSVVYSVITDHVLYYPNPSNIYAKVCYDKNNGKIYGVELIGKNGVDKRIDLFSFAMHTDISIFDLKDIALSYSPPYNNPQDLINTISRIATNIRDFRLKTIYPGESIDLDNTFLIDVREKHETERGMLKNAINISLSELRKKIKELPKDKKIILYCSTGDRSYKAQMLLKNNGFEQVYNLLGGMIWSHYISASCF